MARWSSPWQAFKRETSSMLTKKNAKEFVRWPENSKYESCFLKHLIRFGMYPQRMSPVLLPRVLVRILNSSNSFYGWWNWNLEWRRGVYNWSHNWSPGQPGLDAKIPKAWCRIFLPQPSWMQEASISEGKELFQESLRWLVSFSRTLSGDP